MRKNNGTSSATDKTRQERFWLWSIIGTALVASSLPYLYGAFRAGASYVYLWANPLGPADSNVYFSMMKQAVQGKVFLENLYTNIPQHGALFQPLWLVLGWISGLTHLAIPLVFHVARIVFGGIFLVLLYRLLVRPLFSEMRQRILAMLLLAFSSGIGTFFAFNVKNIHGSLQVTFLLPADQWIPEANTFLTLMHSPLFIVAQLLLLGIFWSFLTLKKNTLWFFVALVALLAMVHPYDIVTCAVLLPTFLIIREIRTRDFSKGSVFLAYHALVLAGIAAFFVMLAFLVANLREPAISVWTQQNITISPPPLSYLLGYGLLIPFAVLGWLVWRKTHNTLRLFILTWVVVSIILLYVPVQINRRFSNGLHIPLAILATVGIDVCWMRVRMVLRRRVWLRQVALSALGWMVGLGLFLSSAITVARTLYWQTNSAHSIYQIRRDEARAIQWLETGTPPDAVILAHSFIGNIIPAMTGRRVFVGHGYLTTHWSEKIDRLMNWFWMTNTDDEAKHAFLVDNNISYLLFGPYEKPIGDFNPTQKSYLVPVHKDGDVTVYRVLP